MLGFPGDFGAIEVSVLLIYSESFIFVTSLLHCLTCVVTSSSPSRLWRGERTSETRPTSR